MSVTIIKKKSKLLLPDVDKFEVGGGGENTHHHL